MGRSEKIRYSLDYPEEDYKYLEEGTYRKELADLLNSGTNPALKEMEQQCTNPRYLVPSALVGTAVGVFLIDLFLSKVLHAPDGARYMIDTIVGVYGFAMGITMPQMVWHGGNLIADKLYKEKK